MGKERRRIIGIHSCREVFRVRPNSVRQCLLKKGWESSKELSSLQEMAKSKGASIKVVSKQELDKLGSGHQGVMLESSESPELNWKNLENAEKSTILALDGVEDPQNLGAILRTAWLLGVNGVLLPASRSAEVTPSVIKVASGGAEHVPVEIHNSLAAPLNTLKEKGYWAVGLAAGEGSNLWSFQIPDKVVWVLGSEAKGVRAQTRSACDEMVNISQASPEASFNVSVTAGIILSETARQKKL